MSILQNISINEGRINATCFYCRCEMSFSIPYNHTTFSVQCPDCNAIFRYKNTEFEKEAREVNGIVNKLKIENNHELSGLIGSLESGKFDNEDDLILLLKIASEKNVRLFAEHLIEQKEYKKYDIVFRHFLKTGKDD